MQAAGLVDRMREECQRFDLPDAFYKLLDRLHARCGEHAEKLGFWHQLNRRHIKPLNNTEAPSARHDEASATSWLAERWTEPKERPPLVPGVGTQQGTQQGMQFTQASQQQLSQLF